VKLVVTETTKKHGVVELEDHMWIRDKGGNVIVLDRYDYLVSGALRNGESFERRVLQEVLT
jgi:hypothetical protein